MNTVVDDLIVILNTDSKSHSQKPTSVKFYLEVGVQPMEDSGRLPLFGLPCFGSRLGELCGRQYPF